MDKIKEIEKIIAGVFEVGEDFVESRSRKFEYVVPRKVLCMVLVKKEQMKQICIANHMGYASHSNVSIHVKTGEWWYESDYNFREKVDKVNDIMHQRFYSSKVA